MHDLTKGLRALFFLVENIAPNGISFCVCSDTHTFLKFNEKCFEDGSNL